MACDVPTLNLVFLKMLPFVVLTILNATLREAQNFWFASSHVVTQQHCCQALEETDKRTCGHS